MATSVRTVFDGTFNPQPSSQTNRRALKLRSPSNTSPILTVNCHTILQRHLDLRGHCQRLATENGDLTCAARRCCRLCSIIIILHHENCLNQGTHWHQKHCFFYVGFNFCTRQFTSEFAPTITLNDNSQ